MRDERPDKRTSLLSRYRRVESRFDVAETSDNNRRHWSLVDSASPDSEANASTRETLRRRSRYEVLNNSYARGVVDMIANDTIGTGPRLQMHLEDESLNSEIERDFDRWAKEINLADTLRLMRRERLVNGETFAIIGTNPMLRSPVKIKIDVVEPDMVCGDTGQMELEELFVDGISFDRYGNPKSYRIHRFTPGSDNDDEYTVIRAEFVIHEFRRHRAGLHRGIPEITSALPLFAQLRRYSLATLSAAESAADYAAVCYTDSPADGESDTIEPLESVPLERNMMLTLPAGWKLGQLDPKHPTSNHSEFVKCILSEIARSVCATYGTLAGDFSGFNYASGRLDNQVYQKSIIVDRSNWERNVLDRILYAWLREWALVNSRTISDDDVEYYDHEWFWDGFMHVDPTKEAEAQAKRLESGTTTLADEYARMGFDYEVKLRQRAKELELMRELGILGKEPSKSTEDRSKQDED